MVFPRSSGWLGTCYGPQVGIKLTAIPLPQLLKYWLLQVHATLPITCFRRQVPSHFDTNLHLIYSVFTRSWQKSGRSVLDSTLINTYGHERESRAERKSDASPMKNHTRKQVLLLFSCPRMSKDKLDAASKFSDLREVWSECCSGI